MASKKIPADEALDLLIQGNQRFIQGLRSIDAMATTHKLKELAEKGQNPFCIVLTCSDSRVPTEIVFDRGLGDLFVIRVAGNVVAPSLLASIEFASTSFGTPLCVVMGHTECGAISSTLDYELKFSEPHSANLRDLIGRIKPAARTAIDHIGKSADKKELCRETTLLNVRNSVSQIRESANGSGLLVVGALYDIHTGKVQFDLTEVKVRNYA